MRRIPLHPPRAVLAGAPSGSAAPGAGRLAVPSPARERRRRLFHPERGWIRLAERRFNNLLAREIYPRVPGLAGIYDRILREQLSVSEAEVALPGLGPELDGLSILLLTDIHAGPFVSPRALRETFGRLAALEPELILLGGDLTSCRIEEFESHREAFRALQAPRGVFAVLGNHDHYTGRPVELRRRIETESGIVVLHNRSVELGQGAGALTLAGVDDLLMGAPDLKMALAGARGPVLLLSHNPDLLFDAAREQVALVLSGHTHAGQIRIPGLPVLVRQSRFRLDEGRFRYARTELIVSRGLGVVGLPWRVACPPEAVLLRLRAAPAPTEG